MYIATPEQPASYLFITSTSHLNHTRPQNAPHATHKFRVLLLNARTQPSFDQTDDGVDAETSLSLSLHVYLSSPPLHFFFSRAHNRSLSLYSLWKCVWAPKSCFPPWRIIEKYCQSGVRHDEFIAMLQIGSEWFVGCGFRGSKCVLPLQSKGIASAWTHKKASVKKFKVHACFKGSNV